MTAVSVKEITFVFIYLFCCIPIDNIAPFPYVFACKLVCSSGMRTKALSSGQMAAKGNGEPGSEGKRCWREGGKI